MPQRPGLPKPYVRAERLFFQEPLQAAPGTDRQRAPGQRPLQLNVAPRNTRPRLGALLPFTAEDRP
ncbi:hypothetical protein OG808_29060 [Streptomyces sp. NBC_01761]|uniref:hypothetical protein n=1 Tax=Streptomyces sp. NBC_01761 TaxID=2975932 RepID=UPI002DD9A082|nr:hypothetical protein [Streptomyces sp. NBC_01761]WSC55981.1 hypothetical protein OG808_29060 [Streptomyces sp. NBC_01761]